jgi:hypothetical protein
MSARSLTRDDAIQCYIRYSLNLHLETGRAARLGLPLLSQLFRNPVISCPRPVLLPKCHQIHHSAESFVVRKVLETWCVSTHSPY